MISCFKSVTLLLDLFKLMAKRLLFLKMIYLTLSESVVHLNHAFGISLLLCLISKLISTAIGYHIFITDVMANGTVKIYWFLTNLPDIIGIFVAIQAAECVHGKVEYNYYYFKLRTIFKFTLHYFI